MQVKKDLSKISCLVMSKGTNWCLVFVHLFLIDISAFAPVTIPCGIMSNYFFVRERCKKKYKVSMFFQLSLSETIQKCNKSYQVHELSLSDIVILASFFSTCNKTLQLVEHSVQLNVSDSTEQRRSSHRNSRNEP